MLYTDEQLAEMNAQHCPACGGGIISLDDPACPMCAPWYWEARSKQIAHAVHEMRLAFVRDHYERAYSAIRYGHRYARHCHCKPYQIRHMMIELAALDYDMTQAAARSWAVRGD